MESLICKNCRRWTKEAPFSTPDDVWKHCDDLDLFTTPETECLARPVSKDSSEDDIEDELDDLESMDLEDQLEYLLSDDVSEIGYDPYLGCYTDDC